jgi:hypothetical protein
MACQGVRRHDSHVRCSVLSKECRGRDRLESLSASLPDRILGYFGNLTDDFATGGRIEGDDGLNIEAHLGVCTEWESVPAVRGKGIG